MQKDHKLRVRDFMIRNILTFTPDMDIVDAIKVLVDRRISGAPVVDRQGNVVGVLTERDGIKTVLQARYHATAGDRVEEHMGRDVVLVDIEESLMDVAKRFAESKYRRFPVMERNRLVGLIRRQDVLRAVLERS